MCRAIGKIGDTDVVVALLVVLFGISSWVDINGLWVELPILTQELPEGWDLPSYMAVIIQVANIAPLIYIIASIFCSHRSIEVPVIYIIISVGFASCLLLCFFWDVTAVVVGEVHSVGLFILQFFLAIVDCTSSVAYLPFMALFRPQYLTAFYVGEGFSGLVPSLLALAQGSGNIRCVNHTQWTNVSRNGTVNLQPVFSMHPVYEKPLFSIEVFFGCLCAMLAVSFGAFVLLIFLPYCQKEKLCNKVSFSNKRCTSSSQPCQCDASVSSYELSSSTESQSSRYHSQLQVSNLNSASNLLEVSREFQERAKYTGEVEVEFDVKVKGLPKSHYLLLLLLTAWINALGNGVLPSIQSYSCLPYGIEAYHLAVTFSSIANPAACFTTFFFISRSLWTICSLCVLGSGFAAYVLYTAALSPNPLFVNMEYKLFTVVLAWVLVVFTLTYTKVCTASILRQKGKRALLWCGAFTQIGSLFGAIVIFVLVNVYKVFKKANMCL